MSLKLDLFAVVLLVGLGPATEAHDIYSHLNDSRGALVRDYPRRAWRQGRLFNPLRRPTAKPDSDLWAGKDPVMRTHRYAAGQHVSYAEAYPLNDVWGAPTKSSSRGKDPQAPIGAT
jgi:hypothetical protein